MPEMPRSNRSRFGIGRSLSILGVLVGFFIVGSIVAERRLPSHEGRSVRAWFLQFCRAGSLGFGPYGDARLYETKIAFLEMGTNALPFLVQEAFTFRKDTFLRTNLHKLFLEFPEWAGRGKFVSYAEVNHRATELLRSIKPPGRVLLPLLEPHLRGSNAMHAAQAYFLLGGVDDVDGTAVPLLLKAATTPTTNLLLRRIAWQSIRWLGARASNALPAALQELNAPSTSSESYLNQALFNWLAELGPAAASAIPTLEPFLMHTNTRTRLGAAVALVYIDPQHAEALRVVTEAATVSSDNAAFTDVHATLCNTISRSPRRENEPLGALLEPLARREASAWGPRGASFQVIRALERVSPTRAALLYESLFNTPGPTPSFAAHAMLQLDRNHEAAAKILVDAIMATPITGGSLVSLGEASSSNRVAIDALEDVVAGRLRPDPADRSSRQWKQHVAVAKASLARIRYREARAARGLPEGDWW